jgi:tetratricopeptide (TPR) repeat protein
VAFHDAMTARIALGDVDGAHGIASAWNRHVPLSIDWSSAARAAEIVRTGGIPGSFAADDDAAGALWVAAASLRRVGRAGDASELCAAVARGPVHPRLPVADAWTCAGVQALRAGLPAEAATYLAQAAALETEATGHDPLIRLMTATAEEASGDTTAATRLFRLEATGPSDRDDGVALRARLIALARLGDLALISGNPLAALEDYDLAAATLERSPPTISSRWEDGSAVMAIRAIDQVLRNNRAVAHLQSLQPSPGEAPSCAGDERAICEAAGTAFAEAIASDPGRGVYHLNAGWVARLLGDATAARAALATAIELDPTLFPASNDLGVLLAKAGDDEGARQAFLDALAAQPDYALARWNLGVLESRAGGAGIINGQASLARAVVLDPTLRDAPLAFRHDEHTYQFTFDPGVPPPAGAPIGRSYSIAAVVLGAAATAAAFIQLQSTMTGKLVKGVSDAGQRRVERPGRRLRPRLAARRRRWRRRLGRAGAALPWLLTAPVLIGLTLWQAARSSPEMAGAAFVIGLIAIVSAIVVHALGHLVAARVLGGRILPAQWLPGVAMAVLLAPIQVATGPFLAERTRIGSQARGSAWWIHAAGPLANAAYAVALYGAYLVTPMPALRLICLMQLAAISYVLLPIRPLDGEVIARQRPWVLVVAGFAMTGVSTAFALGLL